jgi:alcohol dehydrogenase (cytochrome c)
MGGEMGPNIVNRVANLSDEQLDVVIHDGRPTRGMPGFPNLAGPEKTRLVTFLRTLRPRRRAAPVRRTIATTTGATLAGLVLNESLTSLQLRTDDNKVHLLRPESGHYREVTSQADWSTYNGDIRGNRYSQLQQIDKKNASKLASQWIFTMDGTTARAETTPIVVQGIMYVTSGNECWALDAGAGREIWHFQRARTKGLVEMPRRGSTAAWHGWVTASSWSLTMLISSR